MKIKLLSFSALLVLPAIALAQSKTVDFGMYEGAKPTVLIDIIQNIANLIFTFLLIFAVIMILMAAYNYLFSGGDEKKVSTAHKMLIWAAVAVVVGLLAQTIPFIVQSIIVPSSHPPIYNDPIQGTGAFNPNSA